LGNLSAEVGSPSVIKRVSRTNLNIGSNRGSQPLCFLYLFERAGEGVVSDSYSPQTGELLSAMSQLAHVLAVEWVGVYNGTVISRLCSAHS